MLDISSLSGRVEWWLTEDSQVGDWLRFIEEGGTIGPAVEPTTG